MSIRDKRNNMIKEVKDDFQSIIALQASYLIVYILYEHSVILKDTCPYFEEIIHKEAYSKNDNSIHWAFYSQFFSSNNQMIQIFQEDMLEGRFSDNQRMLCSILRIKTERRMWILKRNYQDKTLVIFKKQWTISKPARPTTKMRNILTIRYRALLR